MSGLNKYTQIIWNLAIQSQAEGNIQKQAQLLNHISSLETRLQTLSTGMQKKIEVYDAGKKFIALFQP